MLAARGNDTFVAPTRDCTYTLGIPESAFAPNALGPGLKGAGVRVDGTGYSGMVVTPFYDSLLTAAMAAGLTMGTVSLDALDLRVKFTRNRKYCCANWEQAAAAGRTAAVPRAAAVTARPAQSSAGSAVG